MDKRSLLFIILVSVTFFFANLYFSEQNRQQDLIWKEQMQIKKQRMQDERAQAIQERTKQAFELPLVELYADDAAQEFLSVGVLHQNALLVLGWNESMPKQVFARKYGSHEEFARYQLNALPKFDEPLVLTEAPLVYSQDGNTPFPFVDLPLFGQYDLQLVTPNPRNRKEMTTIALGEYTDGNFLSLRIDLPEHEHIPLAFALLDTEKGFLPVGFVSGLKENLIDLENYASLRANLQRIQLDEGVTEKTAPKSFYVLENKFQQLVFSNIGGALTEINLPFSGPEHPQSVVRPIEVDRDMLTVDPNNALFPSVPAYVIDAQGEKTLNKTPTSGGYYPLLRRTYTAPKTGKVTTIDPEYTAFNTLSEFPEVAELVYEVKSYNSEQLVFQAKQRHRTITKTYRLPQGQEAAPYVFFVDISIDGDSRGLWLSSGVPEAEWVAGNLAPSLKYRKVKGDKSVIEVIDLPQESTLVTTAEPDWICNSNGFFGVIVDPQSTMGSGYRAQKVAGGTVPSRLIALQKQHPDWNPQDLPGYLTLLPLPNKSAKTSLRVFAGPFSTPILNTVDTLFEDPTTGKGPDYISAQSFHGWFAFISEPFAKFLFWIMHFFHSLFGSWALSIVLVTVVLRILLYPLNAWSTKSMLAMKTISPKVQKLQEKYKNDKQKMQQEIFELYRKEKVNPFSGCVPLLIQMPFLIGMFDLLKSTFALRGATFIPGWIDNLAAPDVVFSWDSSLPFIGNQFHLLPILLGVVMFFQARMGTRSKPTEQLTEQERQQKASGLIMAVFFTVLFYKFPSGLNIYWLSSMLLGILQQWWMGRKMEQAKKA